MKSDLWWERLVTGGDRQTEEERGRGERRKKEREREPSFILSRGEFPFQKAIMSDI